MGEKKSVVVRRMDDCPGASAGPDHQFASGRLRVVTGGLAAINNNLVMELGIEVGDIGRLTWEPLRTTTVVFIGQHESRRYTCAACGHHPDDPDEKRQCPRCGIAFRGEVPWSDVAAKYRQEPK